VLLIKEMKCNGINTCRSVDSEGFRIERLL
jgi:hypothetical protein